MVSVARPGVLAAVLILSAARVPACGVCIEDKMAATYDHAVMERAAAQGRAVVFCEVKGPVQAARLRAAAAGIAGIEADSVRVSAEPAALSFAVDPGVQTPEDALVRLQAALDPGVRLALIKWMLPGAARASPAQAGGRSAPRN